VSRKVWGKKKTAIAGGFSGFGLAVSYAASTCTFRFSTAFGLE
jgi:hypothetical protein